MMIERQSDLELCSGRYYKDLVAYGQKTYQRSHKWGLSENSLGKSTFNYIAIDT